MRIQMSIIRHVPHVFDQPALRPAAPHRPEHAHTTSMLYKVQQGHQLLSKQRLRHFHKARSRHVLPPRRFFPGPYYILAINNGNF